MLSFNTSPLDKVTSQEPWLFLSHQSEVGLDRPPLPSWCCDWSLSSRHAIIADEQGLGLSFAASGRRSEPLTIAFNDEEGTLALSVVLVNSITSVSEIEVDDLQGTTEETMRKLFSELERLASEHTAVRPEDNWLEEALFCIPIAYQKQAEHGTGDLLRDAPDDLVDAYRILRSRSEVSDTEGDESTKVKKYLHEAAQRAPGMKIFSCSGEYIDLGPKHAQEGDTLAIIAGAGVRFIIRQQNHGYWRLIGEAYVHDIMYGEFMSVDEPVQQQVVLE